MTSTDGQLPETRDQREGRADPDRAAATSAERAGSAPQGDLDPAQLRAVARAAADAGAEVAMWWRQHADRLLIENKAGPADLVSQADREAEAAIRTLLAERRPDDHVLGEEAGTTTGRSNVRWIVDPIDGTTNYLYGRPDWAVSVAAATVDGILLAGVVAEPMLDRVTEASRGGGTWSRGERVPAPAAVDLQRVLIELNLGHTAQRLRAGSLHDALVPVVRDVRRGGSAAAALAQLVTGRCDAAWLPGLQPWDCAAGVALVQEAGGVVGDLAGETPGTWPDSGDVLATSSALWEPLRALLAPIYREQEAASPLRRSTPPGQLRQS